MKGLGTMTEGLAAGLINCGLSIIITFFLRRWYVNDALCSGQTIVYKKKALRAWSQHQRSAASRAKNLKF